MLSVSKTRKIKSLRPDHKNVEPATTIVIEGEYTHKGHKKKRIKKQTIFDGECFPSDNDNESLAYKKSIQSSVVFNPPDTAPEVLAKSEECFRKSVVAESRLS